MKKIFIYIFLTSILFASCKDSSKDTKEVDTKDSLKVSENFTIHDYPSRTDKSNIYEVNVRQYTPEGTFQAFENHLPRLKKMGVDILWLMPIFPISEKNRKGKMGSYYAVANYTKVNPEFGSEADFKSLIEAAHKDSMLVILDWVANHTGWDNHWIKDHPEWFTKDSTGNVICPVGTDWSDVADLNYDNKEMQAEMIKSLKYWVEKFDVDGFRCDVAGMVPTQFWNDARTELDKVKPVFMLAEGEQLDLHEKAFDMGYAWNLHHIFNKIVKKEKSAKDLREYFEKAQDEYPQKVYRMAFTSNHDENSWNGTVFERMPNSYKTFAALSFVVPGMPLIYSGQEASLDKRLRFFDKDTINWDNLEMGKLYTKLISLKDNNSALWNGEAGSKIYFTNTSNEEKVFTFKREKDDNKILVIMNLSDEDTEFRYMEKDVEKTYVDYFSQEEVKVNPLKMISLKAWEYQILIEK